MQLPTTTSRSFPRGAADPAGGAARLDGMRRLLDSLRSRFDRVILDMPPVVPLADVAVLAPQCDGVLLVVRAGVTPKPLIERRSAPSTRPPAGRRAERSGAGEPEYGYSYEAGYDSPAAVAEHR